ncbi:hypothetical protein ACFL6W_05075 [Thermodesulfobacteriota bacterium]
MIFMIKKHVPVYFVSFLLILLFAAPLYGSEPSQSPANDTNTSSSESGEHDDGYSSDRTGDLIDLAKRYLNFILLVVILVIVFKKAKLMDFFSTRSEEIRQKLEDLKKDKEDAERKFKEVEQQLKNFESRKNEIIEQYKQEGLSEKDKIISEAKARVNHIIEQSDLAIQQEIESARDQLKQDIIELASQKARDILIDKINEVDQEKMVVEFAEKVGKIN